MLFLDKRNQLISDEVQQVGTVDHTPVYPREVIKRALELSATAIILVHNHPSGDPTPSQADIQMTKAIVDIAEPARHRRARPHHRRQERPCEPEGDAADVGDRDHVHRPGELIPVALLPQHDQRIGAVGHAPPLRVVVGLEVPGFAARRHQQDLAALEPPLRRREGRDRRIAFRLEKHLEIVRRRLRCWSASGRRSVWPLPRTIAQSPIIWSIDLASERAAARFCRM